MLDWIIKILDLSGLVILGIFFILLGYRPPWWSRKKADCSKQTNDIPGPLSLPVFGTKWMCTFIGGYSITKIHEYYADMFRKYGPIIKEEALWNVPVISIKDRIDIEKVFRSSGKYPIRPPTEVIAFYRKSRPDRYASGGLANEQGIMWHNLRSALTSELTSTRTISSFLPQIKQIADDWCNYVKCQRDEHGNIKDIKILTEQLGLEATCALVLGRRMGFLLPDSITETARRLADAVQKHFLACRDTYYGLPFYKLYNTPTYAQLIASEESIYTLALELIEKADEDMIDSPIFQSVVHADVNKLEKTAALVDFIAAGIYTLSNSLVFLLHLVGRHPDVQNQLLKELATGSTSYLKACVNESFRMIPTAFCIARILEQDLELSNYYLKAGTVVLCHTGIACQEEGNFKNASQFQPERWLGSEKATTTSTATFLVAPFGIGRRACPGRRFVEQFLTVVLNRAVQEFSIGCHESLKLHFEFLLAAESPVSMKFHDRL